MYLTAASALPAANTISLLSLSIVFELTKESHGFFTGFEAASDTVVAALVDGGNVGTPAVMSYDTFATVFCGVPGFHGSVMIDMYSVVFAGVYVFSLSEHCFCSFR